MNKISNSTRTGYYMKKLLREDCNPDPNSKNPKYHYPVYIRYTEIFLDYAEAATRLGDQRVRELTTTQLTM